MNWIKEHRFTPDNGLTLGVTRLRSDGAAYYALVTLVGKSKEDVEGILTERFDAWLLEDPPLKPDGTRASKGHTVTAFDIDHLVRMQVNDWRSME